MYSHLLNDYIFNLSPSSDQYFKILPIFEGSNPPVGLILVLLPHWGKCKVIGLEENSKILITEGWELQVKSEGQCVFVSVQIILLKYTYKF